MPFRSNRLHGLTSGAPRLASQLLLMTSDLFHAFCCGHQSVAIRVDPNHTPECDAPAVGGQFVLSGNLLVGGDVMNPSRLRVSEQRRRSGWADSAHAFLRLQRSVVGRNERGIDSVQITQRSSS